MEPDLTGLPAAIGPLEQVTVRWSRTAPGWGILTGRTCSGRYAVVVIGPDGRASADNVWDVVTGKRAARRLARGEWAELGL